MKLNDLECSYTTSKILMGTDLYNIENRTVMRRFEINYNSMEGNWLIYIGFGIWGISLVYLLFLYKQVALPCVPLPCGNRQLHDGFGLHTVRTKTRRLGGTCPGHGVRHRDHDVSVLVHTVR